LGEALGEVEVPGGNGRKTVTMDELPDEAYPTCSLSGG